MVPDLEQIVRMYLSSLDKAILGHESSKKNYDWIMLELYDQTVRNKSGGAMVDYLKQDPIPNERYIYERFGIEAKNIIQSIRNRRTMEKKKRTKEKYYLYNCINSINEHLKKLILGKEDYNALTIGRFRMQGEIHQWMYDQYSLAQLLKRSGFNNPAKRTASESAIEGWSKFNLDTEPDGTVYKPDSLYMEAFKY